MGDTPEEIARDVMAIGRIDAVPAVLKVLCQTTGIITTTGVVHVLSNSDIWTFKKAID